MNRAMSSAIKDKLEVLCYFHSVVDAKVEVGVALHQAYRVAHCDITAPEFKAFSFGFSVELIGSGEKVLRDLNNALEDGLKNIKEKLNEQQ